MVFDDLVALISTATPDQIQQLREMVAPVTKLQRLQSEAATLAQTAQTAIARVNDVVARFSNSVQAGDTTVVCPTMDALVAAFQGN